MHGFVDSSSVVELTRALVAADTRNPPGNEHLAVAVAREVLAPLGAECVEFEVSPGRTSLLANIGRGDGSRRTLLVNGHLDVVPIAPEGWTRDPFGGELDGDKLYGRGTADMKGGIAAAIEGLMALRRSGAEPSCDIAFHLVADEERGGALGTEALVAGGHVRADACVVPEPTGMGICVAERGLLAVRIRVEGRPAHASEPTRGLSAIEKAAKVVLAVHAADFGDPAHPHLGRPTANVGEIRGGSGHNTVAESCEVVIDRRLLPGQDRDSAIAGVLARIEGIGDAELRYELAEVMSYGEPSELADDHPFVATMQSSVEAMLGAPATVLGMPFATDARFLRNQLGIPTVVFGPGEIDQAHVHDEWVSVERLVDAAAVFAHLYSTF